MTADTIAMIYAYTALGVGVLLGFAGVGGALGWGLLASKYLEGIARQPEMRPMLMIQTFIFGGLAETIPIIGVGIAFWFVFANPFIGGAESAVQAAVAGAQ
jgi:F-type H+-transporting ATPase subunit c